MLAFFKGFNLARLIILLCLVGTAVLGWMVFERQKQINDYQARLGLDEEFVFRPAVDGMNATQSWVEKKVRSIQQLGNDYTAKMKQLEGEGLKGQDTPQSYIRSIAANRRVALGSLVITPRERENRGYTDKTYAIQPNSTDNSRAKPSFQRTQIANFLWSLEEGSARVKVTGLEIRTPGRRDFEVHPSDMWEFTCELTERVSE